MNSRYIPQSAQEREFLQQLKRRTYGLKTGFYINYPDPEKGPYIIKASRKEYYDAHPELLNLPKQEPKS